MSAHLRLKKLSKRLTLIQKVRRQDKYIRRILAPKYGKWARARKIATFNPNMSHTEWRDRYYPRRGIILG